MRPKRCDRRVDRRGDGRSSRTSATSGRHAPPAASTQRERLELLRRAHRIARLASGRATSSATTCTRPRPVRGRRSPLAVGRARDQGDGPPPRRSHASGRLQVFVEVDAQRVDEDVGGEHHRPERGEQSRSAGRRSARPAARTASSSTPCGSSASWRPNSAISSSSSSSSSASGSSPASISRRRKNVEQTRQSACVEIAWQNTHVAPLAQERRAPRRAADTTASARRARPARGPASTSCWSCARPWRRARRPARARPQGRCARQTGEFAACPDHGSHPLEIGEAGNY